MNWIPAIEVESAHGTREVQLTTHHLMNRVIFLTEEIEFIKTILRAMQGQCEYPETDTSRKLGIMVNMLFPHGQTGSISDLKRLYRKGYQELNVQNVKNTLD